MDLSKLPRLSGKSSEESQTQEKKPAVPEEPSPLQDYDVEDPRPIEPEIFLSLVVGLIFLALGRDFARWGWATMLGKSFDSGVEWTGARAGQTVPYWEVMGHQALTDSSLFLFGVASVLEGLALWIAHARPGLRRPIVMVAFGMALIAAAYSVVVAGVVFNDGGTPLLSLIVIAFSGYMAMSEWHMLKRQGNARVRQS